MLIFYLVSDFSPDFLFVSNVLFFHGEVYFRLIVVFYFSVSFVKILFLLF